MSDEIVIDRPIAELPDVRRIVARARKLRRNSTEVERKLWHRIRDKQIEEFRFRRQRPIGKYIVDFICLDAKLIVELDGGQHSQNVAYDQVRTTFLESLGYRVLRFWNSEVVENISGVLESVRDALLVTRAPTPPSALPLAGEGTGRASASVVANTLPPDGANGGIITETPSLAQRGAGMGVRQQNAASKNAAKDKK